MLSTPRQFGPTRRMPAARQTGTSSACVRSPASPGLREARRQRSRGAHRLLPRTRERRRGPRGGHADDGEVRLGDIAQRGVGREAFNRCGVGVDGVDCPVKPPATRFARPPPRCCRVAATRPPWRPTGAQHVRHSGHGGRALALLEQATAGRGQAGREGDLELARLRANFNRESGLAETSRSSCGCWSAPRR